MINEDFATCNVCGEMITSDADTAGTTKYCRLCEMATKEMKKFCCEKCKVLYKRFIRKKKDEENKRKIKN